MCGIVAYVGDPEVNLIGNLVYEAGIRGLHNLGSYVVKGAGMFHTRYCTSGEDNQPIHYAGRYLVFNGVINMGTKEEMEAEYNIKMNGDNDGEVLLQKCKTDKDILSFIDSKVTIAGIIMDGRRLIAFRNNGRPLWVHHTNLGVVLLASTRDIFKRCGISNCGLLEPFKIYEWTF